MQQAACKGKCIYHHTPVIEKKKGKEKRKKKEMVKNRNQSIKNK